MWTILIGQVLCMARATTAGGNYGLMSAATTGDLSDLAVRCECGEQRSLHEATELDQNPLGTCSGARPWLGAHTEEGCNLPSRLLIRTATNAYFPQAFSVLSLPDRSGAVETAVGALWDTLQVVDSTESLAVIKRLPQVAAGLDGFSDDEVMQAIAAMKSGAAGGRNVKDVELDALLGAPEGFGADVPINPDFHARRLPENSWRHSSLSDGIAAVIQLHRLKEVLALIGFTRLEAAMRDIHGEYDTDVERADIALEPSLVPGGGESRRGNLRAVAVRSRFVVGRGNQRCENAKTNSSQATKHG